MLKKRKLYGKTRTIPVLEKTIDFCSWIKKSSMRTFILFHMQKIIIPSDLVKLLAGADKRKSASYYAQVSRTMAELKAERLIICLNPNEKTGRFYKLTKKGLYILEKLS